MEEKKPKYKLAVGAMFKNEGLAMVEWIEHHLYHGVEHFYLVDDNKSTDDSVERLQPYINRGLVTLYSVNEPYFLGRQSAIYTCYILPHLEETEWLLMIDLDEFVWSPQAIDLRSILDQCSAFSQIQMYQLNFGSNGHETQPKSIVASFTKRCKEDRSGAYKYFVNSKYKFKKLGVHHAEYVNPEDKQSFVILQKNWFSLNHYVLQSREFWETVKCGPTRNDSDGYRVRTKEEFNHIEWNEREDTELLEQNRGLLKQLQLY
jgi:hypothetical protein